MYLVIEILTIDGYSVFPFSNLLELGIQRPKQLQITDQFCMNQLSASRNPAGGETKTQFEVKEKKVAMSNLLNIAPFQQFALKWSQFFWRVGILRDGNRWQNQWFCDNTH